LALFRTDNRISGILTTAFVKSQGASPCHQKPPRGYVRCDAPGINLYDERRDFREKDF